MKKILVIFLTAVIICFCFSGCKQDVKQDNGKMTVYATIYPIYDFACKIGGEKIDVKSIIPKGIEIHEWEPTASDIVNIDKADLLIYNGIGLEAWVDNVKKSLDKDSTQFFCVTDGATAILSEDEQDPHMWLSPVMCKIYLENIASAFCSADSENADYYNANLAKFTEELDKLDKEYKTALSECKQKNIITVHNAFGYLCDEYGLNQIAAEGAVADSEPDASTLAGIVDTAKNNNIKFVFDTKNESSKVAKTLADEIGGEVRAISNLENLTDEETQAGDDYFSVMRTNLETLKEALK